MSNHTIFMVDMDSTILESITINNSKYFDDDGAEISYFYDGKINLVKVKIRPYAESFLQELTQHGKYILWSSGVYEYVNAVMRYFNQKVNIEPMTILTREDMYDIYEEDKYVRYKSMFPICRKNSAKHLFIIEDNPNLIAPNERNYVIEVKPWYRHMNDDRDLLWVTKLINLYFTSNLQFHLLKSKKESSLILIA